MLQYTYIYIYIYICICAIAILNMLYYIHIYILGTSQIQRLCRSAMYVQPQIHLRCMLYLESSLLLKLHFPSMHKFYHSSRHYRIRSHYMISPLELLRFSLVVYFLLPGTELLVISIWCISLKQLFTYFSYIFRKLLLEFLFSFSFCPFTIL